MKFRSSLILFLLLGFIAKTSLAGSFAWDSFDSDKPRKATEEEINSIRALSTHHNNLFGPIKKAEPIKGKSKIVIVGGGPVGLLASLFYLHYGHEVTLLERRGIKESRTREQVLLLDETSIDLLGNFFTLGEMDGLFSTGLLQKVLSGCEMRDSDRRAFVRICDLQRILATRLEFYTGFHFMKAYFLGSKSLPPNLGKELIPFKDPDGEEALPPLSMDVLVGCDGSHSAVRTWAESQKVVYTSNKTQKGYGGYILANKKENKNENTGVFRSGRVDLRAPLPKRRIFRPFSLSDSFYLGFSLTREEYKRVKNDFFAAYDLKQGIFEKYTRVALSDFPYAKMNIFSFSVHYVKYPFQKVSRPNGDFTLRLMGDSCANANFLTFSGVNFGFASVKAFFDREEPPEPKSLFLKAIRKYQECPGEPLASFMRRKITLRTPDPRLDTQRREAYLSLKFYGGQGEVPQISSVKGVYGRLGKPNWSESLLEDPELFSDRKKCYSVFKIICGKNFAVDDLDYKLDESFFVRVLDCWTEYSGIRHYTWRIAHIIGFEKGESCYGKVKIHYKNYSRPRWDEWIPIDSPRLIFYPKPKEENEAVLTSSCH